MKFIIIVVLILVGSIIFSGAVSAVTPYNGVAVCKNSYNQYEPDICGNKVVWTDYSIDSSHSKGYIVAKDIKTGEVTVCDPTSQIASSIANPKLVRKALGNQGYPGGDPKISGNYITWEGSYDEDMGDGASDNLGEDFQDNCEDVWMWNLGNGKFKILPRYGVHKYDYHKMYPDVSGDKIVWEDNRNGDWEIYMYNVGSKSETRITHNSKNQGDAKIDGNIVAWIDYRNAGSTTNCDVYMYNIQTRVTTRVTPVSGYYNYIKIDNNHIYYYSSGKIRRYSIPTHKTTTVLPNASDYDVSNDIIVWTDFRNANDDIYMKNLKTGRESAVCTAPHTQNHPSINGYTVVWEDWRNGNADIYMANIAPPKVVSTTPAKYQVSYSRTGLISIKFSSNIKASTYYNYITVKTLAGTSTSITKAVNKNYLFIKNNIKRSPYKWYTVTIPANSVKDYSGNYLQATYSFRFKTGG